MFTLTFPLYPFQNTLSLFERTLVAISPGFAWLRRASCRVTGQNPAKPLFSLFSPGTVVLREAGWNLLSQAVSILLGQTPVFFASPLGQKATREEDGLLLQEALSGDPGFEKLVRTYEQMVYRVAFRFVGNPTDASDVSQEVFLRVHRALPKFRGESSLSTWIYAITANLGRNAIRSRKNREKVQVLAPKEKDPDARGFWERAADAGAVSSSRRMESRELYEAIQAALLEIPADYREAVILRDMEGMDYEAVAEALETGLGTVKSRIARGRALLRERLKDWL